MTIKKELAEELKDAMRQRDRGRIDVIRQIESEVSVAKSAPGFEGEVDDALYQGVIATYSKKMDKARREYEAAGDRGKDHAEKLGFEIEYLARWAPKGIGEEETREIVKAAISELGIGDPSQMGRLMGHIMKAGHEGLDGGLVNRVAREELASG